jgi:aspartate ammonia-lyase
MKTFFGIALVAAIGIYIGSQNSATVGKIETKSHKVVEALKLPHLVITTIQRCSRQQPSKKHKP